MERSKIIDVAKTYLGTPYTKLDCSAFVRAVYRPLGYVLPRTSAAQGKCLYDKGLAIDIPKSASVTNIIASNLQVGDLIFWGNPRYPTRWRQIHHVAIYAGKGKTIESTPSGKGVHIGNLWETSKWQIVLIADITSLLLKGEEEMLIKKGDSGDMVANVQMALVAVGYGGGMKPELFGTFGSKTEAAVNAFKKSVNLTENGIVDNITVSWLLEKQSDKISAMETYAAGVKAAANMKY